MGKYSYEEGHKQAERDIKTGDVSKSLQENSIFDGSLGASREYKDGYRAALKEAGYEEKDDD